MARLNIVFDFGAVLFGWEPSAIVREAFPAQTQTQWQADQLGRSIFSHADWQSFDAGSVSQAEVVARITQRTDLPLHAVRTMVEQIGHRLPPIADSVAVLRQLRERRDVGEDIGLYFLSNMPEPYARVLEAKHDFIGWFDDGIFSADIKLIKPDLAIYHYATQQFNLAGADTVFIDDSLANIVAARSHGWRGVHLPQPHGLRSSLFDEIGF
jgi:putative hydrolase of the HAD superfamily